VHTYLFVDGLEVVARSDDRMAGLAPGQLLRPGGPLYPTDTPRHVEVAAEQQPEPGLDRHLRPINPQARPVIVRTDVDSIMDMPDVRIGFNSDDRRRSWWRNGLVTLALAGVMVAMILSTHEPSKWWFVGGLGILAVVAFVGTVNLIYGRVLLTARGLEFRTFVSRRIIPWNEVADIETRRRAVRSRVLCDLRVVRVRGRSLTIPGTATSRVMDAELERKQLAIREGWSRAVGG
jgi:hypothetical protein